MADDEGLEGVAFGEDFGQKIDLTVRIREILRNYPEGSSILKELIQNADDAGASEISFCLDRRQHGCDSLAFAKLAPFQGAALLAHNNAQFTDVDFESIQRIGDSLKKDKSKGTKTGRFGVGFNSVYHLTDLPSFISGSKIVFFDPHAAYLPNVNPSNPGKLIDFVANRERLVARYADQFEPFRAFGCDLAAPFAGTLFRLPLRSAEQAARSKLSSHATTADAVSAMLHKFEDEAAAMLIFLKNVARIRVFEWSPGAEAPTELFDAAITNCDADLRALRTFMLRAGDPAAPHNVVPRTVACDYVLNIRTRRRRPPLTLSGGGGDGDSWAADVTRAWMVCNQYGGGRARSIASDPENAHVRFVPWGGVATPVPTADEDPTDVACVGKAYCFLPLPVETRLPVHVNGYFELSSNRRDIWFGDDMAGDGRLRAEWNDALLADVVAPAYARLLAALATLIGNSPHDDLLARYYERFAVVDPPLPWNAVSSAFWGHLEPLAVLHTKLSGGQWAAPAEAIISSSSEASVARVAAALICDGAAVCQPPADVATRVLAHCDQSRELKPPLVRERMRDRAGTVRSHPCLEDLMHTTALLRFVLSDLGAAARSDRSAAELAGVRLVPLASGAVRSFGRRPGALEIPRAMREGVAQLQVMGFSEQQAFAALKMCGGEVESALEHLLSDSATPAATVVDATDVLIASAVQHRIFESSDAVAALVLHSCVDEEIVATLLQPKFSEALLLKAMDASDVASHLSDVLPSVWFGKSEVAWGSDVGDDGGGATTHSAPTISRIWLQHFWSYARTCRDVALFEGWPLLPTMENSLCSLVAPPTCRVMLRPMWLSVAEEGDGLGGDSTSRHSKTLSTLLPRLGLRHLDISAMLALPSSSADDDGSTATPAPPPSYSDVPMTVMQYVLPPNREGLVFGLAAGWNVSSIGGMVELQRMSTTERRALRSVICRGSLSGVEAIGAREVKLLRKLPIFRATADLDSAGEESDGDAFVSLDEQRCIVLSEALEELTIPSAVYGAVGSVAGIRFLCSTPSKADISDCRAALTKDDVGDGDDDLDTYAATLARSESRAAADLLSHLGVEEVAAAAFFSTHFLPKFTSADALGLPIEQTERNVTVLIMLSELSSLCRHDADFLEIAQHACVIPCGRVGSAEGDDDEGRLCAASELFDPEREELTTLLGPECFPAATFRPSEICNALRILGLQTALGRRGVIRSAQSVEALARHSNETGIETTLSELAAEQAHERSRVLLNYVNDNADRLFRGEPRPALTAAPSATIVKKKKKKKKKQGTIWGSITRLVSGGAPEDEDDDGDDDNGAAAEAAALEAKRAADTSVADARSFRSEMLSIAWIPTLRAPLHPCMPWPRSGEADAALDAAMQRQWKELFACRTAALVTPAAARPAEEAWQCSGLYGILDAPTPTSRTLRTMLGWDQPLPSFVLAMQLAQLSDAWGAREKRVVSTAAAEGDDDIAAVEGGDGELSWQRAAAAAVPLLYRELSALRCINDAEQMESVARALRGKRWVWVGDTFVPPERVAFNGAGVTADAKPFIYTMPVELGSYSTLLRRLGVRESFGATDYAAVLRLMHEKCQDSALPEHWLQVAVAMVQALSDGAKSADISDWELFVPDDHCIMCAASDLVFDDAPWLSASSPALSALAKPPRLVHDKLSAAVAARLGVRSLRASLIATSASSLSLSLNPQASLQGEAFGQTEPLTRRLRHILELYAEGPGILNELIQNADDAGATTVKIVFSSHTYASKSLLGPRLAEMQGPALYVYNDATFSENDFRNLSRIGQGSKLSRLETTGRFGLGFNAVYHFTDVPSFVTGNSVVMFDPHASFIPGATTAAPGVRIRFGSQGKVGGGGGGGDGSSGPDLRSQFPDQFEPFLLFGCDLRSKFDGTLFRFPLRTADGAKNSEIKKEHYPLDHVADLLASFREQASRTLLFLHNIKSVEVYHAGEDGTPTPRFKFAVTVKGREAGSRAAKMWNAIPDFISGNGSSGAKLSREAFYAKLGRTNPRDLPRSQQLVTVGFEEAAVAVPLVEEETPGAEEGIVAIVAPAAAAAAPMVGRVMKLKEVYIVCQMLGAGRAREMACEPSNLTMKLMPWAGIAALISSTEMVASASDTTAATKSALLPPSTIIEVDPLRGRGYCFLPLPVETRLPVHVNGYFELSSNRRDIWFGDDMAGVGQKRSQWNQCLLADVVAPVYARLLSTAARHCGNTPRFLSLWPTTSPTEPWDLVTQGLFKIIQRNHQLKIFHSPGRSGGTGDDDGVWVSAVDAVLAPSAPHAPSASEGERALLLRVAEVLLLANVPIVWLPPQLCSALLDSGACTQSLTPEWTRNFVRTKTGRMARQFVDAPAAATLLSFCLSDVANLKERDFADIDGLPLIPSRMGSVGCIRVGEQREESPLENFYLCETPLEIAIMARAPHCVVECEHEPMLLKAITSLMNATALTNIRRMSPSVLVATMPLLLPTHWKGRGEVSWAPSAETGKIAAVSSSGGGGTAGDQREEGPLPPSREWISSFWEYISRTEVASSSSTSGSGSVMAGMEGAIDLALFAGNEAWPLLPAVCGDDLFLLTLGKGSWSCVGAGLEQQGQVSDEGGVLGGVGGGGDGRGEDGARNPATSIVSSTSSHSQTPLTSVPLRECLRCIGVRLVETTLLPPIPTPSIWKFVRRPDAAGLLGAVVAVAGGRNGLPKAFGDVGPVERRAFRAYMAEHLPSSVGNPGDEKYEAYRICMRRCPVFDVYAGPSASLGEGVYSMFPPSGTSEAGGAAAAAAEPVSGNVLALAKLRTQFAALERPTKTGSESPPPKRLPPREMIDDADFSELLLLGPRYLCCGVRGAMPRDNAVMLERLLLWLGVERVIKARFLLDDVLPHLETLPDDLRSAALVRALEDLPRLNREHDGFTEQLVATPFVPTALPGASATKLRLPADLYDPAEAQLQKLLSPTCFPAAPFNEESVLRALRTLGLRKILTREGVLESARGIERDSDEDGVVGDEAVERSRQLLAFLDGHLPEMLAVKPTSEVDMFMEALMRISWMPVHRLAASTTAPSAPWHPSGTHPRVMAPSLVRPMSEIWLCSHARGILDGETHSELLRSYLGWGEPLAAEIVAAQLVLIAEKQAAGAGAGAAEEAGAVIALRATMAVQLPRIYLHLSSALELVRLPEVVEVKEEGGAEREDAKSASTSTPSPPAPPTAPRDPEAVQSAQRVVETLSEGGHPWIWVGHTFADADSVAFASPADAMPLKMYQVPSDIECFAYLLRSCGVRESFTSRDFAHAIERMARASGATPLLDATLDAVVAMLPLIVGDESQQCRVLLPNAAGKLCAPSKLVYNDAEWLSSGGGAESASPGVGYEFVHKKVPISIAAKLGACSLRSLLLTDQTNGKSIQNFSCPGAMQLQRRIRSFPGGECEIMRDVMRVGDILGSTSIEALFDRRTHSHESVLHPALASMQGPALMLRLDGVILSIEQVVELFSTRGALASAAGTTSATERVGSALTNCFNVSDCVQVLSGSQFYILDPCLRCETVSKKDSARQSGGGSGLAAAREAAGIGQAYRFVGTDICARFPDQFEPFTSEPMRVNMAHPVPCTIIRLPLRSALPSEEGASSAAEKMLESEGELKEGEGGGGDAASKDEAASVDDVRLAALATELGQKLGVIGRPTRIINEACTQLGIATIRCSELELAQACVEALAAKQARRLTMRTFGSALEMQSMMVMCKSMLRPSLLFLENVERVTVTRWLDRAEGPSVVAAVALSNRATSRLRRDVARSMDWKEEGFLGLGRLFSKAPKPKMGAFTLRTSFATEDGAVVDEWAVRSIMGASAARTLALQSSVAAFAPKPYAALAAHLSSNGSGALAETSGLQLNGMLCTRAPNAIRLGLPFFVNGCFELNDDTDRSFCVGVSADTVSLRARRAQWNRVLFESTMEELLPSLLQDLRDRFNARGQKLARGFYRYWPLKSRTEETFRSLLAPSLMRSLGEGEFFLLPEKRRRKSKMDRHRTSVKFGKLRDGHFLPSPHATKSLRGLKDKAKPKKAAATTTSRGAVAVASAAAHFTEEDHGCSLLHGFCARHFTMLDVPAEVGLSENLGLDDASGASSRSSSKATVSSEMVRSFLAGNIAVARAEVELHGERMAMQLLCFCLADVIDAAPANKSTAYRAALKVMRGLPLIVTADGNIASLSAVSGSSRMRTQTGSSDAGFLFATEELRHLLLPALSSRVVLLEMQTELVAWLQKNGLRAEEMGMAWCNPLVLARHMDLVLPPAWKGRSFVRWDEPGVGRAPTRLWLRRFWKFVAIDDPHAVGMFRQWPLIPTKSGELVGCASAAAVMAVWRDSADGALLDLLDAEDDEADDGSVAGDDDGVVDAASRDGGGVAAASSASASSEGEGDAATVSNPFMDLPPPPLPPLPPRPEPEIAAAAAAGASITALEPRRLHELLTLINIPMLELAFFRRGGKTLEFVNEKTHELPRRIIKSLSLLTRLRDPLHGGPQWSNASSVQIEALLCGCAHPEAVLAPADLDELKRLPLFAMPSGSHVSIESGSFFTASADVQTVDELPMLLGGTDAERRLLERREMPVAHLHQRLGIAELTLAGLLTKYLLPEYMRMAPPQQRGLRTCLANRWDSLRDDRALLARMKELPLLPDQRGQLRLVSSFLDPAVPVVALVFDDMPERFPLPEFSESDRWLSLLRDIGLKTEVDGDLFVECALHVEQLWRDASQRRRQPDPDAIAIAVAKADKLLKFLWQNFSAISQGSPGFWTRLADITIVPVHNVEKNEKQKVFGGGGRDALSATIGVTTRTLAKYSACVVPKDSALAWTVLPIIPEEVLPPGPWHGRLKIRSPPARQVVLAHLQNICSSAVQSRASGGGRGGGAAPPLPGSLQHWTYARPPVEVFRSIFDYLTLEWSSLSSSEKDLVGSLSCVPIGNRLVRPAGRLFFRLAESLAPLMFEVPRAFGANDKLLKALGTKDTPTVQDFVRLLQELRKTSGDMPLNPNELEAVLRVVALMSQVGQSDGVAFASGAESQKTLVHFLRRTVGRDVVVLVPDERGVLSDATSW